MNKEIAIIEPNTLAGLGLRHLLQQMMPVQYIEMDRLMVIIMCSATIRLMILTIQDLMRKTILIHHQIQEIQDIQDIQEIQVPTKDIEA